MGFQKDSEKRVRLRRKAAVPVRYESKTMSLIDTSEDISEGGVFVNSPLLDEVGTRADIEIVVPGSGMVLRTKGKVRWHTPVGNLHHDDPKLSGMGIEFTNIEPWAAALLRDWVLNGNGQVGNS
ncbi:MAG: hypothetical protein GXP49_07630 [Deltaproteobacteria bacterium]|nr:hypothetical protein [Deltaproteobacteria bacterium]